MGLVIFTLGLAAALIVTSEAMYRFGRTRTDLYDEKLGGQISTVQAATLGLLALVLGFTMSMAEGRYNTRRQILVAEANAVGTTYLRADILPEPERTRTRELLRRYIDERLAYFSASEGEAPAVTVRSQAIAADVWNLAVETARLHPDWDVLSSYLEATTDMIELEATRDLAIRARVPGLIDSLLLLIAFTAMGVTGFATGLSRTRTALTLYIVPVLIALACAVINDLDRTRFGFISTGDRPMQRLKLKLETTHGPTSATR
jgi:hypothetical protein